MSDPFLCVPIRGEIFPLLPNFKNSMKYEILNPWNPVVVTCVGLGMCSISQWRAASHRYIWLSGSVMFLSKQEIKTCGMQPHQLNKENPSLNQRRGISNKNSLTLISMGDPRCTFSLCYICDLILLFDCNFCYCCRGAPQKFQQQAMAGHDVAAV